MSADYLFVYGTLKREFNHPVAQQISTWMEFIDEASVKGRLYDCGSYPGLVLDVGDSIVRGELFRVLDSERVFSVLDAYEGCSTDDPQPHEYRRVSVDVFLSDEMINAWVYDYRADTSQLTRIDSERY